MRDHPLQEQLYEQLLDLIQSGRLQSGTRMPSSRMLADQFSVSRTTVLLTYERLIAEGWLETLPAAGTFVTRRRVAKPRSPVSIAPGHDPHADQIDAPDPSLFPAARWRTLMRNMLDRVGSHTADHPSGHRPLREAIAEWLSISRGVAVAPDQIIIVNSRQHAIQAAAYLTLSHGSRVVVEEPADPRVVNAFLRTGATVVPVPVDSDGIHVESLPDGPTSLIYVTPEHQRMLGVRLDRDRRMPLVEWAARSNAIILEEDCNGDLRTDGVSAPCLMSLDQDDRVIMVGGFCRTMGPWLTLSYLVVPPRLVGAAIAARHQFDDSTHRLDESALAEFIASGAYARHVHRLGKTYAERRTALVAALDSRFGSEIEVWSSGTGLHLSCLLSDEMRSPESIAALARRSGLDTSGVTDVRTRDGTSVPALLLGFGRMDERRIEASIARLAALMSDTPLAAAAD